ncbi:MAG: Ig-like domain-containing protein, partial [Solirubrobacteraceae bacterium]
GASFPISFTLSKISNVTLTITNGSGTVFTTTSQVPYGTDSFTVPALGAGSYTVTLSATDLAGNVGTTAATLTVQ